MFNANRCPCSPNKGPSAIHPALTHKIRKPPLATNCIRLDSYVIANRFQAPKPVLFKRCSPNKALRRLAISCGLRAAVLLSLYHFDAIGGKSQLLGSEIARPHWCGVSTQVPRSTGLCHAALRTLRVVVHPSRPRFSRRRECSGRRTCCCTCVARLALTFCAACPCSYDLVDDPATDDIVSWGPDGLRWATMSRQEAAGCTRQQQHLGQQAMLPSLMLCCSLSFIHNGTTGAAENHNQLPRWRAWLDVCMLDVCMQLLVLRMQPHPPTSSAGACLHLAPSLPLYY